MYYSEVHKVLSGPESATTYIDCLALYRNEWAVPGLLDPGNMIESSMRGANDSVTRHRHVLYG
jgi:hypothetical protein